ncbi:aromatic prenyltransferase [Streptomyces sp. NPDC020917]|uniref:aromatic prenyltransferase n=1 Tax=Streptomyces sp. NPDC020917 TaxID=3365102 RepID=UPI0037889650
MSETTELADLYSVIEESARLLEVPYSRDKVRPILTAYQDALRSEPIAFRMGMGERYTGDVDWRFSVPVEDDEPYSVALAHGLLDSTDHPVFSLLGEATERCNVSSYGVDFGVVGGLKKMYVVFPPDDMADLAALRDLPSMPPSVAGNYDTFARHGMVGKLVPTFAIDYRDRTVNLYWNFSVLPAATLAPDGVRALFRDLGLRAPSDRMIELSKQAIGAYVTLGWDSARVERFSFTVLAKDPADLPVPMEPELRKFHADFRHHADDDTFLYYVAVSSSGEEIYKYAQYYRSKAFVNQMLQSTPGERRNG